MDNEKKNPLSEMMETTVARIQKMVDSNSVVGEPIQTPDGVTVIPITRVSFGFGTGGSDYGKTVDKFSGAGAAGVRIEPVSFLIIKDGVTRVVPVALPVSNALERIVDMVPEVMDRVDNMVAQKRSGKREL